MYLKKPFEPDSEGLKRNILRKSTPERVYNIELFLDIEVQKAAAEYFDLSYREYFEDPYAPPTAGTLDLRMKARLELHRFLGYDIIRAYPQNYEWKAKHKEGEDTTPDEKNRGKRSWQDEGIGPISTWNDFEKYPWPDPSKVDLSEFDWCEKKLPDGMGFYSLTAHILEYVTALMGYEGLCYAIYDQPDLVDAMFKRVGEIQVDYTRQIVDYNKFVAVWGSDDMGFKGGCLIGPDILIEKALPWHKKCAEIAHQHNKLYLLHSCGKLDDIMEPLINDVKIDAKHSWEDTILPVTEAKKRWGHRIGILGGIDMNFLINADEQQIRKRVHQTLDICLPGGGYCLGTGNSVANYIPLENYLAMLDEGRNYL
ncbi:MAG: uroporphyrinogen decarboxylase family protein [Candidatus Ratteibacteria bacterium]|nr:uroporphyrinogen decarboxylase family protein [Candidatus Ratteibacteria bacterium]